VRKIFSQIVFYFLASFLVWPPSAFALEYEDYPVVRLRSLDKITARTMTFDAKVGSTVKFGDIFIKIQSCRKPPPVEKNEAASFLQIWQINKAMGESNWVFSGWMFSSSPTLSAMNHSIYDVWVLDCLGKDPEELPLPEEEVTQDPSIVPEGPVSPDQVQEPTQSPEEQKTIPRTEPQPDSGEIPLETPPATRDELPSRSDLPTDETPADDSSPIPPSQNEAPKPEEPSPPSSFDGIY
jgi:hypothetical protein